MKNTQKGFIVPLLIAIIVVFAIGGGVYIYENKKSETPVILNTDEQNSQNTTTPVVVNPTVTLKTYTDVNQGFSFKYPSSWTYQKFSCNLDGVAFYPTGSNAVTCGTDSPVAPIYLYPKSGGQQTTSASLVLSTQFSSNNSYKGIFDQMIKSFTSTVKTTPTEKDIVGYYKGSLDGDQYMAFSIGDDGTHQYDSWLHERPSKSGTWSLSKTGALTVIYDNQGTKPLVFSSVVRQGNKLTIKGTIDGYDYDNTFTYLGEDALDAETLSWKTYTNTQYGFSIKYPQDWQISSKALSFVDSLNISKTFGTGPQGYTCSSDINLIATSVFEQNAYSFNSASISGWQVTTPTIYNHSFVEWTNNTNFPGTFVYYFKNKSSQYSYGINDSIKTLGVYNQNSKTWTTMSQNIHVRECEDIFSQMITTLKFTN